MANLIENEVFGKFDKRADGALKKECMRKFKTGKDNKNEAKNETDYRALHSTFFLY